MKPTKEITVQIAPFGTFESHDGIPEHEGMMQVVDNEAVDAMVAAFDKELLVDLDHQSCDGGSTEAAAWVTKVWKDPKLGLMGTFRLTSKGEEIVSDKRFQFVSPVWFLDENQKPTKLDSVALTNRPNLPVKALLNRKAPQKWRNSVAFLLQNALCNPGGSSDGSSKNALKTANLNAGDKPAQPQPKERTPAMDELKTVLGLGADATEADIANAVKALKAENDELKQAKADADAEQFATANANKGIDHATLKQAYLDAPQVAKNMVAKLTVETPQPKTPVCVSKNAHKPDRAAVKNARAGLKACKTPQERCDYVMKHAAELAETND